MNSIKVRDAVISALSEHEGDTVYLPPSHLKALRLDTHIVVGGTGTGKTFMTKVLQSERLRKGLGLKELEEISVRVGFSETEDQTRYPDAATFDAFLNQGGDAYDLWRAVILRWVAEESGQEIPRQSWQETVAWLKSAPESAARVMQQPRNRRGLILFDAVERLGTSWRRMDDIVRGLMRAVLWLKPFSGLYAKVFLRKDLIVRMTLNFPDASKLAATEVELRWARHNLYGLLWHRLINAPSPYGEYMREICPHVRKGNAWHLTDEMKVESEAQRMAFGRLAGQRMKQYGRRVVPYHWIPSTLADATNVVTPGPFITAIRRAAEDSAMYHAWYEIPLYPESVRRGIREGSEARVQELAKDYPWLPDLLSALKGMQLPCGQEEILAKWETRFPHGPESLGSGCLPPMNANLGWKGVLQDLQDLGVLKMTKEGVSFSLVALEIIASEDKALKLIRDGVLTEPHAWNLGFFKKDIVCLCKNRGMEIEEIEVPVTDCVGAVHMVRAWKKKE